MSRPVNYKAIAEKTLQWLETEEGQFALQKAKTTAKNRTEKFEESLRIDPRTMSKQITL